MSYDFGIYLTGVSPAQAIGLFNEEVEEGRESYAIAKEEGAYVFYSGFTRQFTSEIIFESTGMSLEVYARCSMSGSASRDASQLISMMIDNALHKTSEDFLALSQFEWIIAMRKNREVIVNVCETRGSGLDLRIFDMPHHIRELPPF